MPLLASLELHGFYVFWLLMILRVLRSNGYFRMPFSCGCPGAFLMTRVRLWVMMHAVKVQCHFNHIIQKHSHHDSTLSIQQDIFLACSTMSHCISFLLLLAFWEKVTMFRKHTELVSMSLRGAFTNYLNFL